MNPSSTSSHDTGTSNGNGIDANSRFHAAYQRRLGQILAVQDEDLSALNLDVRSVVVTVRGCLPEIRRFREEMGKLHDLDLEAVDSLGDLAEATGEALSLYHLAMTPKEDIVALNEEAVKARELFRSDMIALSHRGLIDPDQLAKFRGLVGYKNVAFELLDFVNLARAHWPAILGKTALTEAELARAKDVAERLVDATGLREQAPIQIAEAARIRQQALTLLINAYNETRRAIVYLRWNQDDADTIAPSLYAGRTRRRDDAPKANADTGSAPVTPQPAVPATASPAAPAVAMNNNHNPSPVPVGHPGTSPYVS